MVVLITAVLGMLYPVAMTGAAQGLFPDKADGSLVKVDGSVVGSDLAGQDFTSPAVLPLAAVGDDARRTTRRPRRSPTWARTRSALQDAVDANIAAALKLERPYNPGLRGAGPAGGHGHDVRLGHRPGHLAGERAPAGAPHRRDPRRAARRGSSTDRRQHRGPLARLPRRGRRERPPAQPRPGPARRSAPRHDDHRHLAPAGAVHAGDRRPGDLGVAPQAGPAGAGPQPGDVRRRGRAAPSRPGSSWPTCSAGAPTTCGSPASSRSGCG